jgi:hypothetical protein
VEGVVGPESAPEVPADAPNAPDPDRCETCGGTVRFDPAAQQLRCDKCRATSAPKPGSGTLDALDYLTAAGDAGPNTDDREAARLECVECGATTDLANNALSGSCPYCHTPFVGAPASTRTLFPGCLLPLAITHDDARAKVKVWMGNRWFAPRALNTDSALGTLDAAYTPCWLFSLTVTATYDGQRGDDYTEWVTTTSYQDGKAVTSTHPETRTRWHGVHGTVRHHFGRLVIFSGGDPLSHLAEALGPWDFDALVPYGDDYLRGADASAYAANLPAGFHGAVAATKETVAGLIEEDIGGDHQRISDTQPRYTDVSFRYALVPGWVSDYRFHGTDYRVGVNGRTGKVEGTRPYSKAKIVLAVLAALAVVAALIFAYGSTRQPAPPPRATTTTTPRTREVLPPATSGTQPRPTSSPPDPTTTMPLTAPSEGPPAESSTEVAPTTIAQAVALGLDPSTVPRDE